MNSPGGEHYTQAKNLSQNKTSNRGGGESEPDAGEKTLSALEKRKEELVSEEPAGPEVT